MTQYEFWSLVLSATIAIAAFGTFVVYYRQLRVMQRQITALEKTSKGQRSLDIISFIQSDEIRMARHYLRETLGSKSVDSWSDSDKIEASKVVANYDVVGAILKEDPELVPLIIKNWGPSIRHCFLVSKTFIELHREKPGGDPNYWSNFEWLYNQIDDLEEQVE